MILSGWVMVLTQNFSRLNYYYFYVFITLLKGLQLNEWCSLMHKFKLHEVNQDT